jgi:3-oxoacyl-[acyl-carrier protein] reductase
VDDPLRFDGRIAVVTGAAQGIGEAIAIAFAEAGADVAVCDRDRAGLDRVAGAVSEAGRTALSAEIDVRDEYQVETFLRAVGGRFGTIDVLVNNAGGTYAAPFADSGPKGDETLLRLNLLSAAWFTRHALPLLAGRSSVINITSIESRRAAPGFAVYGAAKAGLEALTRTLALELGERGVRVNAIAPDVIETPGIGALPDPPRTPLGRWGTPADVAGVALWLASPLAGFVTGAVIPVDGGNAAAGGWRRTEWGAWET